MKKQSISLLFAIIILMACNDSTKPNLSASGNAETNQANDVEAIKKLARQEVHGVNAGDHAGLISIIANDAEVITLNQAPAKGDQARQMVRDFLSNNTVIIEPFTNEEIEVSGDLAYHRYTYSWKIIPSASNDTIIEKGTGIHIMKRQGDSTWKFVKDIWVPSSTVVRNK